MEDTQAPVVPASGIGTTALARLQMRVLPDERGRRPGFTLARHTAQQLAAAAHPHELPPSDRSYLYLDAAQHGLGSRACGPDVWPDFILKPQASSLQLTFSAGKAHS